MTDRSSGSLIARPPTRVAHTGHQAIRDVKGKTVGFELFFRDSATAVDASDRTTSATLQVLADHAASPEAGGSHLYFVNVTRDFLVGSHSLPTPTQIAVLEVQPDVTADGAVLEGVESLRAAGYGVALDRYLPGRADGHDQLLRFASHVKLDLDSAGDSALEHAAAFVRQHSHALLIGTKIGTGERYDKAKQLGCELFQGWAVDEVRRHDRKVLLGSLAQYIKLLELLAVDDAVVDMRQVTAAVMRDPDLSMRVLRACNSAAVGLRQPLRSVQQAVALLGVRWLRRAVHLGIAQGLAAGGDDQLRELIEYATLTDLVGQRSGLAPGSGFLIGLLVQVAEATETSIADVLQNLPIADDLAEGLRQGTGPSGQTLLVIDSFKRGEPIPDSAPVALDEVRELHVRALRVAVGLTDSVGHPSPDAPATYVLPEIWTGPVPGDDDTTPVALDENLLFGPPPTTRQQAEAEAWNAWSLDHARRLVAHASVPLERLPDVLGLDDRELRALMASNRLLVVDLDGELLVPIWQFSATGLPLDGLDDVIAAYPGDALSLAEWLIRPSTALGGQIPVLLLAQGGATTVVEHTRGMRTW